MFRIEDLYGDVVNVLDSHSLIETLSFVPHSYFLGKGLLFFIFNVTLSPGYGLYLLTVF